MKKIFILLLVFYLWGSIGLYAQKEIWCYKVNYNQINPEVPNANGNDGQIIKVPLVGGTYLPEIMHTFDITAVQGKFPLGRLFQASNGKLYGVTNSYYDLSGGPAIETLGVLFEYDLILDKYRVVATGLREPKFGVIEPIPGFIYGTTNSGNSIFKYNIATETLTIVASIPGYLYNNNPYYSNFNGELMKASDGYLYGVTDQAPTSQNIPAPGGIYRMNIVTNQLNKIFVFGLNAAVPVFYPQYAARLVEGQNGKLYGTSQGGTHFGLNAPSGYFPLGSGTLFEYTIATSTMAMKYDFDCYSIGGYAANTILGNNNKLYGTLFSINDSSFPNQYGSVYEYDLTTDMLTVLHVVNPFAGDYTRFLRNISLKASDGNFYGISQECMYKFDPLTNNITNVIPIDQTGDLQEPIEICRKPSYHEITTSTFTPCVGSAFAYDVQNTNATSYAWSQNGTVLPTQTTGTLTIPSIAITDNGAYTCTMTNECGTTVTMPLQITASCLSVDDITANNNSLKLYPNPAKNILNIKLPDNKNFDIQKIIITNMLGQQVYNDTKNLTKVEVSKLPIGIYEVVLKTDKGDWSGKFVKE